MNDILSPDQKIKLSEIDVKSDGLYLSTGSIIANWMGGHFPAEWIERYAESVGNDGNLTFSQIVDFFDAHSSHDSNHNSGIYSAIFLSKYMTDKTGALDAAKSSIDRLRLSLGDTARGNEDSLYYSAILFRDSFANYLLNKAVAKYGDMHGDYSKLSEIKQLKNVATNAIKKIVLGEINGGVSRLQYHHIFQEIGNLS